MRPGQRDVEGTIGETSHIALQQPVGLGSAIKQTDWWNR
jgi:hypothetical protein